MVTVPSLHSIAHLRLTQFVVEDQDVCTAEGGHWETLLAQLDRGAWGAESKAILDRIVKYYGHKLSSKVLDALLPSGSKSLCIARCPLVSTSCLDDLIKRCPHLFSLDLSGNEHFSFVQIDLFQPQSQLTFNAMTNICLEDCAGVSDQVVQCLLQNAPSLLHLNIAHCDITDSVFLVNETKQLAREAGYELPPLTDCYDAQLQTVDVSRCSAFTSTGVRHLCTLCGPSLKDINLSWTKVDAIALLYLSGLGFPSAIQFHMSADILPRQVVEALLKNVKDLNERTQRVLSKWMSDNINSAVPSGNQTSPCLGNGKVFHHGDDDVKKSAVVNDKSMKGDDEKLRENSHVEHELGASQSKNALDISAVIDAGQGERVGNGQEDGNSSTVDQELTGGANNSVEDLGVKADLENCENPEGEAIDSPQSLEPHGQQNSEPQAPQSSESQSLEPPQGGADLSPHVVLTSVNGEAVSLLHHLASLDEEISAVPSQGQCSGPLSLPQDEDVVSVDAVQCVVDDRTKDSTPVCDGTDQLTSDSETDVLIQPLGCTHQQTESLSTDNEKNESIDTREADQAKTNAILHGASSVSEIGSGDQIGSIQYDQSNHPKSEKVADSDSQPIENKDLNDSSLLMKPQGKDLIDALLPPKPQGKDRYPQFFQPQLTSLALNGTVFKEELAGIQCFTKFLKSNSKVSQIKLFGGLNCHQVPDEVLVLISQYSPRLTSLVLEGCDRITDSGIYHLRDLKELTSVDFTGLAFIGDVSIVLLTYDHLFTRMLLAESQCTDAALKTIAGRPISKSLKDLDLSWCEDIDVDDPLNVLVESCTSLERLMLRSCPLSATTLALIAENCRNLTELSIASNMNIVQDESVTLLAESLPLLEIIDLGWNSHLTNDSICALMKNCSHLVIAHLEGLKLISAVPFKNIIAVPDELQQYVQSLLEQCTMEFLNVEELLNKAKSVQFSDLPCLPHRSTTYCTELRELYLNYSDLVEDAWLEQIVAVTQDSIKVVNYYGEEVPEMPEVMLTFVKNLIEAQLSL